MNETEKNELTPAIIIEQSGLDKTDAEKINEHFTSLFAEAKLWEVEARSIVITDASQIDEMKKARELRLKLRNTRTSAEKVKTSLKENVLIRGRLIDGLYNAVVAVTKPLEEHLEAQEKYVELMAEKARNELRESREAELRPYGVDVKFYKLEDMPEESFQRLLDDSRTMFEKRAADEAAEKERAEAERIERERENARLQAELAAERAKAAAAEAENARIRLEKEQNDRLVAQAEKDAIIAAQRLLEGNDTAKLTHISEKVSELSQSLLEIANSMESDNGKKVGSMVIELLAKVKNYVDTNTK